MDEKKEKILNVFCFFCFDPGTQVVSDRAGCRGDDDDDVKRRILLLASLLG